MESITLYELERNFYQYAKISEFEEITVTVNGFPVGKLVPSGDKPLIDN